jgi:membrane protein DedA with SNARE-associated domain
MPGLGVTMLWILFLALLFGWLVGMVISYTMGGWIHLFLALAVVTLILQVTRRQRSVH